MAEKGKKATFMGNVFTNGRKQELANQGTVILLGTGRPQVGPSVAIHPDANGTRPVPGVCI